VTLRLGPYEGVNLLVGTRFPEADEDALWRCADAWAAAAAELRQLTPQAVSAGRDVVAVLGGEAGPAFEELWHRFTAAGEGYVDQLADACERLAAACDQTAREVEYAKIQYICALLILAATIWWLSGLAVAGGASAIGIPVAIGVAQITIRAVLMRLVSAVAFGTALNVALDGVAQATQIVRDHRDGWDWAKTGRAAEDGAIYGALTGGVLMGGGRLAPNLINTLPGALGGVALAGAAGAGAAGLAHGEMPGADDFFMSTTSAIVGSLGRRPGHGEVPELGHLTALDPISHLPLDTMDFPGAVHPDGPAPHGGPPLDGRPGAAPDPSGPPSRDGPPAPVSPFEPAPHPPVDRPAQVPGAAEPTPHRTVSPIDGPISHTGLPTTASPDPTSGAVPPLVAAPGSGAVIGPTPSPTGPPAHPTSGATAGPSPADATATLAGGVATTLPSAGELAPTQPAGPPPPVGATPVGAIPEGSPSAAVVSGPGLLSSLDPTGAPAVDALRPEAHDHGPPGDVTPATGGPLSLDEAVGVVRRTAFTTNAGLAFYPAGDHVRPFAQAVRPTDGYVTLDLHGSPTGFLIDHHVLTPEQFAAALRELQADGVVALGDGVGIKLLSCETAIGGPDSAAARLARALGVEVIAPDQAVWTTLDGTEIVASSTIYNGVWVPTHPPDGAWHIFDPTGGDTALDREVPPDQTDPETRAQSRGEDAQPRAPDASPPTNRDQGGVSRGLEQLTWTDPTTFDPSGLRGRTPAEVEAAIPRDWTRVPSRSGGGTVYWDPDRTGRTIRVMPGYVEGNRPDTMTHGPYVVVSQNGIRTRVPLAGNPTIMGGAS